MFSSKTDLWTTPQEFYNKLNEEFGFTLDPASTHQNTKCKRHYTIDEDGLKQDWGGEVVFCNPPYGRSVGEWARKCYEESKKPDTRVVLLIFARTDTKWWHQYCMNGEIRFVKGRLKFGDSKNAAPAPSAVIIFGYDVECSKVSAIA